MEFIRRSFFKEFMQFSIPIKLLKDLLMSVQSKKLDTIAKVIGNNKIKILTIEIFKINYVN